MNNETAPTDQGTSELALAVYVGYRRVGAKGYERIDKVQF